MSTFKMLFKDELMQLSWIREAYQQRVGLSFGGIGIVIDNISDNGVITSASGSRHHITKCSETGSYRINTTIGNNQYVVDIYDAYVGEHSWSIDGPNYL